MTSDDFRKNGYKVIDWVADYLEQIENYPVKSQVAPRHIFNQLPDSPPATGEPFEQLLKDLNEIIMPGITHWQHPNFHAFFTANNSFPSILAETISAGLGVQGMIWETSPAAAELEEKVMEWLKQMMHLPPSWSGVIQDTASTATLVALLSARENKTGFRSNEEGLQNQILRVYCSAETHSSIEKGAKIAGFGKNNVVPVSTKPDLSMDTDALEEEIKKDLENGFIPCVVVSTQGTTGTLAVDDVKEAGRIAAKYDCWHHVDAAYAGNAFILPEFQAYTEAFGKVDSFVFNPHKWLFTNFDCSAYFIKDRELLLRTFEILPEYLKTESRGKVNDYRDWGIQLGRRFRALKLWFVIRTFGLEGLQEKIREHIEFARWFEQKIAQDERFEIMVPRVFNLVVFRFNPGDLDNVRLNDINKQLLEKINSSGQAYLTHTKIQEKYVIRVNFGGTYLQMKHVKKIWSIVLAACK